MVALDALLYVDGGGAFRTVEKELMVKVEAVPVHGTMHTRAGPDAVYHVQSVNNYHERLKSWINAELHGVATKYLPNYLAWMLTFGLVISVFHDINQLLICHKTYYANRFLGILADLSKNHKLR